MNIKKFNKTVEMYKTHSVIQNLYKTRGAVNFYFAPKLRRDLDMDRIHMTVYTIRRYFQSKIISTSHKSRFNSVTYNGLII